MALDPYSLCPCGSGKKLKFCCTDIVNDMLKALQLHEGGQSRAALKILQKLHAQEPGRAWPATSLAGILLFLEEPAQAREALVALLQDTPDLPLGRVLDATAALELEGFEGARATIHRAFTKSVKTLPEMVGSLANGLAMLLLEEDRFMAARQHLAFAMKYVRDEDRQEIFMQMLNLDGDATVPYPLRGAHHLKPLQFDVEAEAIFKKALGLSAFGCWHEAAAVAQPLLETHATNADLWYNVGLFHAWDGNHASAASCFHRAGEVSEDREFAIACETLAQILDHELDHEENESGFYVTHALSKLLTVLDDSPLLVRLPPDPRAQPMEAPGERYLILDHPVESIPERIETWDDVKSLPLIVGSLALREIQENGHAHSICRLWADPGYGDHCKQHVHDLAGDLLEPLSLDAAESSVSEWKEFHQIDQRPYLPDSVSPATQRLVAKLFWNHGVEEVWANRSLKGLHGKTPREAANIPELSIKLAAAVNVLDAFANKRRIRLDLEALKTSLGLPPTAPYEITSDNQINTCDVLQMLRVPVASLTEEQLRLLINRAQLIQHRGFTEQILNCAVRYPHLQEPSRMRQILHAYIDLASDEDDPNIILGRIEQARNWARELGEKFEDMLQWELRELQARMQQSDDAELTGFLNQLHSRFLRKLPQLEEAVTSILLQAGITPPWGSSLETALPSSGIWSPEAAVPNPGGKLWIPGQD